MQRLMSRSRCASIAFVALLLGAAVKAESSYATNVVSYDPGSPPPNLTDPSRALGEPSRMNDDDFFPTVVTAFNPVFIHIVSVGPGGHLTLAFDSPIVDDPAHPFGIDLIVFGNSFFADADHPNGVVSGLVQDGGMIEVSDDGDTWYSVPDIAADGLYPTIGYLDSGPYDQEPGDMPTDFTRPVDPSLTISDFVNLSNDEIIALYDGSGGGAGIDISDAGLTTVQYLRISNPTDALATVEVDAIAKVSPQVVGDLNGDGAVDGQDLLILLGGWGVCPPKTCPTDLSDDGVVDGLDLLILLGNWG